MSSRIICLVRQIVLKAATRCYQSYVTHTDGLDYYNVKLKFPPYIISRNPSLGTYEHILNEHLSIMCLCALGIKCLRLHAPILFLPISNSPRLSLNPKRNRSDPLLSPTLTISKGEGRSKTWWSGRNPVIPVQYLL